jgi:poly(3-hydroxybutyrate) depolymerase
MHCRSSLVLSVAMGFLTVGSFACSPSGGGTVAGSGGSTTSSGGQPGTGGTSSSGGQAGTGGASGTGGKVGTGGASGTGGTTASGNGGAATGGTSAQSSGGRSGSGGTSAAGGSTSSSGQPGTGGESAAGGRSASGGTTSQPGTGGATGGNSGRDGGPATGGAGGGAAIDGGGSTPAGQSAGCGKTPTIASSQYNNGNPISITVNGSQRRYILNVPTNYDNTKPYKFILAVHQLNGNDVEMYKENYYGLLSLSNNTTIFAAPNGVNGSTPCSGTGSGDGGCGWPAGNNNMQLMDAVVKQVTDNFCIDTNRIFATGWSYGASMSYEIGCERPLGGPAATATWGVRAVANYSVAQMSGSCKPSTSYPVAYYLSHGTCDSVLTYDGTARCSTQTGEAGGIGLSKNWSNADGCTWQLPTKVTSGAHVCTKMAGCKAGYPVEVCSFNGDHTPWPDNQQPNDGKSWGPPEVWNFLSQF